MTKTYFSGLGITVTDEGVTTPDKFYRYKELGPIRALDRRGNTYVVLNIVSASGQILESFLFERKDELGALNAVNAINQALGDNTQTPVVSTPPPPPAQRTTAGWIGVVAGGIVAAGIILWLLSVIF